MKKTIYLILLLVQIYSYGQINDKIICNLNENGQLVGESIVNLNEKTESEIYKKCIEWIAYTFRNTQAVVQSKIDDKMIRITGTTKSIFKGSMGYQFDLSYLIQIDIKENRIRFTATNLKMVSQHSPFTETPLSALYKKGVLRTEKKIVKYKEQTDDELTRLQNDLTNFIMNKQKDDW